MQFSYSIVIRTLGNTGEKYRRMLEALRADTKTLRSKRSAVADHFGRSV